MRARSRRGREPSGPSAWWEIERCQAKRRRAECHMGLTRCTLPRQRRQTDGRKSGHGSGGGLTGGTPGSSFCRGWGTGYMRAGAAGGGTAVGLWGGSPSPRRCCGFGSSPPAGWASRRTRPRCCTARHPPAPGSAPPCRRSCSARRPEWSRGCGWNGTACYELLPMVGVLLKSGSDRVSRAKRGWRGQLHRTGDILSL